MNQPSSGASSGRTVKSQAKHNPARRILFVTPTLSGGGAERFISTVLTSLDRKRFECRLALFHPEIRYRLDPDIAVDILGGTKGLRKLRTIARLSRLIDEYRPDVVAGAFWYPNMILGEALGFCSHEPAAIAWIASNPEKNPYDSGINRLWARRNYRRYNRLVAVSEGVKRAALRVYSSSCDRVTVLPNPIDFELVDLAASEPIKGHITLPKGRILVSAARLKPVKRLDLLLEAFAKVYREHDVGLLILGEGPERARLETRIQSLEIGERVCMPGHVNNPYQWMRKADIFVLSSDYEGFPIALAEAQGLGLPAVATDCRYGPREIVANGTTGLLVPPGDPCAMARAIGRLLSRPETIPNMGRLARERVRRLYSMSSLLQELEDILVNPKASACEDRSDVDSRPRPPHQGRP